MLRKIAGIARALHARIEMHRYDDFTIAEHFRGLGAQVGKDCRLLIRSLGSEPWLVRIGDHVTVSFDVTILTHDGAAWVFTREIPSIQRFAPVDIGDNCFIGACAIIMPGVKIGPNSIVGAGALVTKDVPPDTVVAGLPARIVCSVEDYRRKVMESWAVQRPPGYLDELEPGKHSAATIHAHKLAAVGRLRRHLQQHFWGKAS